jgi:hypothetical protein
MIDLTFNMGEWWKKKNSSGGIMWKNTVAAFERGDFEAAADGLKNSLWYKQVKSRGPKIVDMVRNGRDKTKTGSLPTTIPDTGRQVNEKSSENQGLRKQMEQPRSSQQVTNNISQPTISGETRKMEEAVDDRPAHERKK